MNSSSRGLWMDMKGFAYFERAFTAIFRLARARCTFAWYLFMELFAYIPIF